MSSTDPAPDPGIDQDKDRYFKAAVILVSTHSERRNIVANMGLLGDMLVAGTDPDHIQESIQAINAEVAILDITTCGPEIVAQFRAFNSTMPIIIVAKDEATARKACEGTEPSDFVLLTPEGLALRAIIEKVLAAVPPAEATESAPAT